MGNTSLPAVIYARVSQDKRAGRSTGEQEAESRQACADNGWTVAEVYRDPNRSASRFATRARENWTKLLTDLEAGRFGVLVLWESSRGGRELELWARLLNVCRRHGVLVHVVSHDRTYDLSVPRDWRTLAEDGVDSAYESEKTSVRIRRAMVANAQEGRPHGRTPYGYERVYDPMTKALVEQRPHPAEAPIVREIITRAAGSVPISSIVDDLNTRGVPTATGSRWIRAEVRRIALSWTYLGKRQYGGDVLDGDWPPLVDERTFYAARRVLLDPARRTTRPGRARWLLSYLARCGECDEARLHAFPRGTEGKSPVYGCARGCAAVRADWLDDYITLLVFERLADPDFHAEHLTGHDDAEVVAARAEAEALRSRLDEFIDSAARGEISPAALGRIETKLRADIAEAEKRAAGAATPLVLRDALEAGGGEDDLETRRDAVAAYWEGLPVAARREIVRSLLEVRLHAAAAPGRTRAFDPSRVEVTWRGTDG